ncbi:MAG: Rrf2 family transcriptional regulator [Calditrichaeota bacterium]|nr:MAG: Rrf2 family transcriptional regulator [Calditrichota bacterium]MBL1204114.1 Rrf2 family transcriptional regulator [Calditrichota bacterium]NOG43945.1 Rrf2 family transcriptional regulator [Calditrichota bacterium]
MLRLSKKVEYALIALMDLANNSETDPVTTKALASSYQIPQELLGKVMQNLTKNGILNSVQGVKGGYILGQDPENIKLMQIIEILEGPISITSCGHLDEIEDCGCDLLSTCTIKSPMEIIQAELEKYFTGISLKDLNKMYNNNQTAPIQLV